jgi:hypothetical protein
MKLPQKAMLRRTLLSLWLPSSLVLMYAASFLLNETNNIRPTFIPYVAQEGVSLFAAAPPKGSVLGDSVVANADIRAAKIAKFLRDKNSPMVGSAGTFVTIADRYRLDWRLLVAIAGKESTYGRHIPPGSYNAWGWGIPTGAQSGIGFRSWDEGIEVVGRGLRTKYYDRGLDTLAEIESAYTPPSAANPEHPWRTGVARFMYELERY